jgi:diguanylate cyclase (GGDEF)-like protein
MAIYITADRYKSILFIAIANALKLTCVILSYIKIYTQFNTDAIANFLMIVQVTFWVAAIFVILRLNVKKYVAPIVVINILNLAQGIFFTYIVFDVELMHSLNSALIAITAIFCVIVVSKRRFDSKRTEIIILIVSLAFFTAFHIMRAVICLNSSIAAGNFDSECSPNKFMATLRYAFFHLMNFVIIYMNHTYLIRKVRTLSYTDKLTGALNRGFFLKVLEVKMGDLKRSTKNLVLAILDIDDFKNVNDSYGHLVGDEVLKEFTAHLKENVRTNDIICRYGGEEFLILMEVAGKDEGDQALRRLQYSVRSHTFSHHQIHITFSCGMEYLNDTNDDRGINDIIKLIDDRLYAAKHAGKDCII